MRVLLATSNPPAYMQPPLLGDEQINCGPDWPDEKTPDGRFVSLATPEKDYDLAAVAARLPADQAPDLVVCLIDSSWRNHPQNLAAFKCPRVLLVADTHHLNSPIVWMMRYMLSEPFERIVLLYDRHHAAFFHSLGLRNLYWFPGLTFPHTDAIVRQARQTGPRARRIAFVGQAGSSHPRRASLLEALLQRQLPLELQSIRQREALGFYGQSRLAFNCSVNGDLNLRVFETLAAGAALLTDRLAPAAGLDRLLRDDREVIYYSDATELADRAEHYLSHPTKAAALGAAGARWFDKHFNEARRRAAFKALAFDGTALPEFEFTPAEQTRVFFGGDTSQLLKTLMVYEGVQELHRTQQNVRVSLGAGSPEELPEIFSTLPRVQLTAPAAAGSPGADLAVFSRAQAYAMPASTAARLWCHDASPEELAGMTAKFLAAGFVLPSEEVSLFERPAPPAEIARRTAIKARESFTQGDLKTAQALAHNAVATDDGCRDAHVVLGELALKDNHAALAERHLSRAHELHAGDPAVELPLGQARLKQQKLPAAAECFGSVLRTQPENLAALLGMGRVHELEHRPEAAEAALRDAVRLHPTNAGAVLAMGDFLKRSGQVFEALGWHCRAWGYPGTIPLPRTGAKRRVLFVVQHASMWTSMASIFAAFRADPHWSATLVAMPYNHPYFPDTADRMSIFGFLEKEGLPFVRWDQFSLKPNCADVLFLQNPYDVTRPPGWRTEELLRVVPRIAYAPYGIELGGTLENANNQFNQSLHNLSWAVFARSEAHRALFEKHGRVGNAHVIATGHPKFDLLCNLSTHEVDAELAAFTRGRPTVLWNPQFDIRPDGSGFSTFLTWWKFLPEEFARRQELAFIIRPHPLFFTTLEARGLLTRAQIDGFLGRCEAAGNILIDRRPTYLAVFAASDAMISDGSSFLIEYGATGKPICYLHNPRGPLAHLHYELDLDFVREKCVWAECEPDILSFLDSVKSANGPDLAARTTAAQRQLSVNPSGAGLAIKHAVDARLDHEVNAVEPALLAV